MKMGQADFESDFVWADDPILAEDYADVYTLDIGGGNVQSVGEEPSFLENLMNVGTRAVDVWLSYDARKELQDLNLERARRGQAPIDAATYMRSTAPQVRVGVTPDTQRMVIYAGLGLLTLFAAHTLLKR